MRYLCFAVFISCFFISKVSFALECYAIIDGKDQYAETVRVNDIIIPESSADGAIIWQSPRYTRHVKCNKADVDEYAYFYPFPKIAPASLPKGMTFGLIYNGTSYDLTSSNFKIKTDIFVKKGQEGSGVVNVQVYIKKNGIISGGYNGDLPIYQLDGVGGINSWGGKNFRFNLSNLNNVTTGSCTYSLNGIQRARPINVNDNLILNGQTISSVDSVSVYCTPADKLKNRTANMDLYIINSSGGQYFGTDKDGLSYQLIMSGTIITPSVTSGSPRTIPFKLDVNAKGSLDFDQKVFLLSADKDWLYQKGEITANSKSPNLRMKVNSFE